MRVLTLFLAAVLLIVPSAASGQVLRECSFLEDWLLPPLPGQLLVAQRTFNPPTDEGPGVVRFNPNVAEFATEDLAAASFSVGVDRMLTRVPGIVREDVGTAILDESAVFTWERSGDRGPVEYAELVFRDGRYVHAWQIRTIETDPVRPLFDVIRHLLARGRLPASAETPSAASDLAWLFDQLPEAQDVPSDLHLVREGCGVRREAGTDEATPISGRVGS